MDLHNTKFIYVKLFLYQNVAQKVYYKIIKYELL